MTTLWLDHLIFGNGHGMATPYWRGSFYWLDHELYWRTGAFGSQLASVQWSTPAPQERRTLLPGRTFQPYSASRRWGRCLVTWRAVDFPADLNQGHAYLQQLDHDLANLRSLL